MNAKKLVGIIIALGIGVWTLGVSGCTIKESDDNNNEVNSGDKVYTVYQTYVAYAEEKGDRVLSYEQWLESIKGKDGTNGSDGRDGRDGRDGKNGNDGRDGADGKDGNDGKDGSYIVSAKQVYADKWNIAYYFEFTLSDGSKITTEENPSIIIIPGAEYTAETEEERETLLGYGVSPQNINYQSPEEPDPEPAQIEMQYPVADAEIVAEFGYMRNESLSGAWFVHMGWDFKAVVGTEVVAALDGTVEEISVDKLDGTVITVAHENGFKTKYGFVEIKDGLSVGDTVTAGERIATIAEATGNEFSRGAHLHFEIIENGQPIDPASIFSSK